MAPPTRLTPEEIIRYFRSGFWQPKTLADFWEENASRNPQGIAVTDGCQSFSWSEARRWSDRLALALVDSGIERDEVLVVQLPNCAELPLIRVACEKAGILCVPVPRTLRHHEMRHCLKFTEARAVLIPRRYREFDYFEMIQELKPDLHHLTHVIVAGEDVPPPGRSLTDLICHPCEERPSFSRLKSRRYQANEVSLINATTGSTGLPKFAEYPAAARLLYGRAYIEVLGLTHNDVIMALSPAAGGPNIPLYFAAPQVGAKSVLMPHFAAEAAFALIEKEKATLVCLVPAQLAILVHHARPNCYDLSSVRFWLSVGAPLAANLAREGEEKLGGIVLDTYGAVDWGGVVFTSPEDRSEARYTTVGRPRVGTEVRLVDEKGEVVKQGSVGELQGRGPTCSTGFYKNPEATQTSWTIDGWFPLGDLGYWDEEGNLCIVGRRSELIIRGGQNIQPGEIENHLLAHPKIAQAAVVGMADSVMGERVCAYVVPRSDERPSLEEITSFLRERKIALYKLPERLEVVESLPMISDSKVDKRVLAADIAGKLERERPDEPAFTQRKTSNKEFL